MNLYASTLLFTTVISLALGLVVYLKGKNKPPNVTLALYTLCVAIWTFGQFMGEISTLKQEVLFWTRFNSVGAIFIPILFLHFVLSFLGRTGVKKRLLYFAYLLGGAFLAADFTPLFIADVAPRLMFKYYPVPGVVYPLFVAMLLSFIGYGFYELFRGVRKSSGMQRNQIIYVLLAAGIGFAGGLTALLPIFNIPVYPFGHYFMPLYIFIAAYAIARYRFLDITIVIRKGIVYSTLIGLFTGVYILIILSLGQVFQAVTGFNSILATALTVMAFAAVFQPLRDRVQEGVDRVLFKGKYDYYKTLRELSSAVVSVIDVDELLQLVVTRVTQAMGIKEASIFLWDKKSEEYTLRKSLGLKGGNLKVSSAYPLIKFLKEHNQAVIRDELPQEWWEMKEGLHKLQAHMCVPLWSKDGLIGIFNLSSKLSGDMFTGEDIDLLTTLTNQVAVAMENAQLYEEILTAQRKLYQADKLASLGEIAAGMAHEIKNPLASIKGLTQILPENVEDQGFLHKFTEIVPRQLDRIDKLVNDLLKFGRPSKLHITEVNINHILESILRLIENQCQKKKVAILRDLKELSVVKGDQEQLTQALMNIILNAVSAMTKGGGLKVATTLRSRQVCIEIADTGIGIPEDKVKNIFDPFYTDKEGGTGLGLSIAYRIIKAHNGSIEVKSKIGEGTTFTIYL